MSQDVDLRVIDYEKLIKALHQVIPEHGDSERSARIERVDFILDKVTSGIVMQEGKRWCIVLNNEHLDGYEENPWHELSTLLCKALGVEEDASFRSSTYDDEVFEVLLDSAEDLVSSVEDPEALVAEMDQCLPLPKSGSVQT
jgi:hypothetical protein